MKYYLMDFTVSSISSRMIGFYQIWRGTYKKGTKTCSIDGTIVATILAVGGCIWRDGSNIQQLSFGSDSSLAASIKEYDSLEDLMLDKTEYFL